MNTESTLQAAPARRARPNEFRNLSERCGTGYQTLINAALRHRLAAPSVENSLA